MPNETFNYLFNINRRSYCNGSVNQSQKEMEQELKKGDTVMITIGGRKGETGKVTEIRFGVKYSVQVLFQGQAVSTPYATDELKLIKSENTKKLNPVLTLIVIAGLCLLFCYLLLNYSISQEASQRVDDKIDSVYSDSAAVPLSDTVARIPN